MTLKLSLPRRLFKLSCRYSILEVASNSGTCPSSFSTTIGQFTRVAARPEVRWPWSGIKGAGGILS